MMKGIARLNLHVMVGVSLLLYNSSHWWQIRSSTHNTLRTERREFLQASCLERDGIARFRPLMRFQHQLHHHCTSWPTSPLNSLSLGYPGKTGRTQTSCSCNPIVEIVMAGQYIVKQHNMSNIQRHKDLRQHMKYQLWIRKQETRENKALDIPVTVAIDAHCMAAVW